MNLIDVTYYYNMMCGSDQYISFRSTQPCFSNYERNRRILYFMITHNSTNTIMDRVCVHVLRIIRIAPDEWYYELKFTVIRFTT